jgi:Uma2 family endonuclease
MSQTSPETVTSATPALVLAKISVEQYHRMIDAGIWDDRRVELLNGIIVEMSPEGIPHASKRTKAQEYLAKVLGETVQLRIAAPITLPAGSEPEPDIAVVQRQDDEYETHHPYPEDIFWVIEYSHTSLEKDLGIKAEICAAAGIAEYWVVNLKAAKLIVLRDPIDGQYQSQQEFTSGSLSPRSSSDVEIEVVKLLG